MSLAEIEAPPAGLKTGVLQSDREKFEEWAADMEPQIRGWCFWYLSGLEEDAEEPEDIAQTVLKKCWDQISKDPTEGWRLLKMQGWIKTLTKNACIDLWRKPERKRELKLELTSEQFEADDPQQDRGREGHPRERLRQQDQLFSATCDPRHGRLFDHLLDPELRLLQTELGADLKAELLTLPPNQRKVLALFYFGGLPQKQIAEILGLSPGTVNSHLTRGLRNLRRGLASRSREIEAHLWRLERAFRGRWLIRVSKPPAVLAPPLMRHSAGFCSRAPRFEHLRLFHDGGAGRPDLECSPDCASCENLRERSRSEDARRSGEDQASAIAPQRIVSPGWVSAPVPDDPDDIALMQKIDATLALVREWFPRRHYPTKVQIQEEWEKPVLDLERTLERILAEVLTAERVLTSSPARPAFLGPAPDDLEDIALPQRIHAALALVREWFTRRLYLTERQIREEWKKRVLDLERTLKRVLAEGLDAERVFSCCTSEDWEEWNEWMLGWRERELRRERILATTVREVRRAWWLERELRDVAYVLNTDDVRARFGNRWHYTGVRLFKQRNAALAERQRT